MITFLKPAGGIHLSIFAVFDGKYTVTVNVTVTAPNQYMHFFQFLQFLMPYFTVDTHTLLPNSSLFLLLLLFCRNTLYQSSCLVIATIFWM